MDVTGLMYTNVYIVATDFPTTAPGWPSASAGIHDNKTRTDSSYLNQS